MLKTGQKLGTGKYSSTVAWLKIYQVYRNQYSSVQTNLSGRFRPPPHPSLRRRRRRRRRRARRRRLLRLLRHLRLPSLLSLLRLLRLLRLLLCLLRLLTSQRRPAPASARPVFPRLVHRRRQIRRIAPHAGAAGTAAPRDSGGARGDGRGQEGSLLNLFLCETVLLLPELVQVQAVRVGARRIPEICRAVLGRAEVGTQLSTLQPVPADFAGGARHTSDTRATEAGAGPGAGLQYFNYYHTYMPTSSHTKS